MPGDMPRAPVAKRMILWVKSVRKPGQLLECAYGICVGLGMGEGNGGTVENADRKLARNKSAPSCKHSYSWSGG